VSQEILVLTDTNTETLVLEEVQHLIERITQVEVLDANEGAQTLEIVTAGPQGPAGTNEDDMPYTKRIDFVGDTTMYKGEADPGTAESAAKWRIQRLTFVGDDVTYEWAAGTAAFDKVWANRAALSYM
jgi:hypothetical protein